MDLSDGIDYEQLDPGIRKVVRWLRENGFDTTDSGDGETKADVARAFDMPHVAMTIKPQQVLSEANRLWGMLKAHLPRQIDEVHVEASYDPADDSAVLLLLRLRDRMLPW